MSLINRLTVWTIGQILKTADLNGEFNNIVNTFNNLDGATTNWTNCKATTGTFTNLSPGTLIGSLTGGGFNITGLGTAGATTINGTNINATGQFQKNSINFPPIYQVVQATSTTAFTTTSSSFQTTNLSLAITPTTATSKILIFANGPLSINTTTGASANATIARGGTNLAGTAGFQILVPTVTGTSLEVPCSMVYLDSPASGSAQTYAVQIRNSNGTATVQFGDSNQTQIIVLVDVGL